MTGRGPSPARSWSALETAAGRQVRCIGKPEPSISQEALDRLGDCGRVAVIGDDVTTDTAGVFAAGLDSVLVRTGTSASVEVEAGDPGSTWVAVSLQQALGDVAPKRLWSPVTLVMNVPN